MLKPIFKDPELQSNFEQDGFVKISLLQPADIAALRALYAEFHPETISGFHSSTYSEDYQFKLEISKKTSSIINARLKEHLQDYRTIGASFLAKSTGSHSEMPMHQDWTIVDEDRFVAINVWTPLVDCSEENGTLEVITGSHRYLKVKRMPTLEFVLEGKQQDLKPFLTPIPTKAGEAIFINQALIHYSKPSTKRELRIAITTGVVSQEADLVLYYFDKNHPDRLEVFQQEDDFLLRFTDFMRDIYMRPKTGSSIGYIPYSRPDLDWNTVLEEIKKAKVESRFNLEHMAKSSKWGISALWNWIFSP